MKRVLGSDSKYAQFVELHEKIGKIDLDNPEALELLSKARELIQQAGEKEGVWKAPL